MNATDIYVTNEYEVSLPPLSMERKSVWDYYRLEFLPNGYPGRRTDGTLFAHPIYGPYVIADYLIQYRRTKDPGYLDAACRVADAALDHMESFHDGLVFMYSEEKAKVSSKKGTWYSGLTQSRYIDVFTKLLTKPGTERFREPLSGILSSLTIPVEKGGVARTTSDGGLIIEEYPALFPDCTLNGWTTATCIIKDLATTSGDEFVWDIFSRSVRGIESVISLYDVPELATSRYKLEGHAMLRLVAAGASVEIRDCRVEIPGTGTFEANVGGDPAGEVLKDGHVTVSPGRVEVLKLSLSRFSWPAPNRVVLRVYAPENAQLTVSLGDAEYNPLATVPRVRSYQVLREFAVKEGESLIELELPWTAAEMISHPTNFVKKIAGRQVNQYHFIHVDTLAKIVAQTGSDVLRYYHDRWKQYPSRWPELAPYQDDRLTLERFDVNKHK
ncbi:D-glucuronyl C5-epimerase family protein [Paenarthrobacter sp. NPDC089989]|uniref:D-glucuronyl C5-epimerase family protein n=1 Tax=unclassified Paenarthrobacter TaxID=2634190 RepID=UPI00380CC26B